MMISEADQRLFHVLSGKHLPDPEAEIVTCPACGHTFSEAENDHFSPEPEQRPDPMALLAEALRAGGY